MTWSSYHNLTKDKPPHRSLINAVKYLKTKDKALDIGSGSFRDSRYLLTKFKKVTAIDQEIFLKIPKGLKFFQTSFEKFKFPKNEYDLVNAQFSLPFISKKSFLKVWKNIKDSLKSEGVFVGQFFGIKDQWNVPGKKMIFHNKEQVEGFFEDFDILYFKEEKKKGYLANGDKKYWHVFHVIAKKN